MFNLAFLLVKSCPFPLFVPYLFDSQGTIRIIGEKLAKKLSNPGPTKPPCQRPFLCQRVQRSKFHVQSRFFTRKIVPFSFIRTLFIRFPGNNTHNWRRSCLSQVQQNHPVSVHFFASAFSAQNFMFNLAFLLVKSCPFPLFVPYLFDSQGTIRIIGEKLAKKLSKPGPTKPPCQRPFLCQRVQRSKFHVQSRFFTRKIVPFFFICTLFIRFPGYNTHHWLRSCLSQVQQNHPVSVHFFASAFSAQNFMFNLAFLLVKSCPFFIYSCLDSRLPGVIRIIGEEVVIARSNKTTLSASISLPARSALKISCSISLFYS